MMTLWQDIKYGARTLLKTPGFTIVAVLALALGIGANTAIFSVVNSVLLRPLPFNEPDRLVAIYDNFLKQDLLRIDVSVPEFIDYQEQAHSFESLAAYSDFNANLAATDGAEPERIEAQAVTHELFAVLGATPHQGRIFLPEEDQPGRDNVVLIGYGLWQRRFGGNAGVVGQSLSVNGQNMTVVGVMSPGFAFPQAAELWAPFGFTPEQRAQTQRGSRFLSVVGRLKPDVSVAQAQAEMDATANNIVQRYPQNYGSSPQKSGWSISVVPLHDVYVGDIRPALLVLLGAVGFVLLIACANVTNLLLARGAAREKELAIRAALGAGRLRVIRQLLTESVLLALVGGAVGLLLAVWGVELLTSLMPDNLSRMGEVRLDGRVLGFTFAVSLLTGVLFGLAPAWQASQSNPNETLKEGGRSGAGGGKRQRVRSALIVSEVALALVLLIGAGLMLKSFGRLLNINPGFNPDYVLTMRVPLPALPGTTYAEPPARAAFYRQTLTRVAALPGIERVAATSILPLSPTTSSGTTTAENSVVGPNDLAVEADWRWVTPDYFNALDATLVRGRYFAEGDTRETERVAVVDESFARRFYPGEDAIGKRIKRGGFNSQNPWMKIVGIVRHIKHRRLEADSHVQAYFPYYQDSLPAAMSLVVRARPGTDPASLSVAVRGAVQEVDKNQPVFNVRTMQQIVSESVAQQRLSMLLLAVFAGLALLLAAIGLYGVMAYLVSTRKHEIGIRMALGARAADIFKLVISQGMVLTLIGIGVGLLGAFALTRLMASLLYGVSATDPLTFAVITLLLAGVALLACYIPARRATKVDPIIALRYE